MGLFRKMKKNNKASFSYIEKGITYMVLFILGTFIIDIILLGVTMVTLNHQVTYLGNKLSFQGGFMGETADTRHWSNETIYNYLKGGMVKVGIDGVENQWGLDYKQDINGSWKSMINTGNNPSYERGYRSPSTINSKGIASNFHESSSIRLWFDYEYKFSGKIFNFANIFTRMHFDMDFVNEYIS